MSVSTWDWSHTCTCESVVSLRTVSVHYWVQFSLQRQLSAAYVMVCQPAERHSVITVSYRNVKSSQILVPDIWPSYCQSKNGAIFITQKLSVNEVLFKILQGSVFTQTVRWTNYIPSCKFPTVYKCEKLWKLVVVHKLIAIIKGRKDAIFIVNSLTFQWNKWFEYKIWYMTCMTLYVLCLNPLKQSYFLPFVGQGSPN